MREWPCPEEATATRQFRLKSQYLLASCGLDGRIETALQDFQASLPQQARRTQTIEPREKWADFLPSQAASQTSRYLAKIPGWPEPHRPWAQKSHISPELGASEGV
jgi:hypothetical protein